MKLFISLLLMVIPILSFSQDSIYNHIKFPSDTAAFFDYLNFYKTYYPSDTSEGGFVKNLTKESYLWVPRLQPDGDARRANPNYVKYSKEFNFGNKSNCNNTGN